MITIRESEHTKVIAIDEPDQSGACHEYEIYEITDTFFNDNLSIEHLTSVQFQKGPVKEKGVNGCQIEDLIAICVDRLEGFQSGPYPCEENADALHYMGLALIKLEQRTEERKQRGVEGKNIK